MGFTRLGIGLVGALLVLAGCGSTGSGRQPSVVAALPPSPGMASATSPPPSPEPTASQPARSGPATAPSQAATAGPTPTSAASASGPVVLTSTLYPYRIMVPVGPSSFVPARAKWDGIAALGSSSVTMDHARAPGSGLVFIAMTDTTLDADAFAAHMEERMRAWHACTPAAGRRSFAAGELRGVGFTQRCVGEPFVRAVVVGRGHALFAFSGAGPDADASLEGVIELLRGVEWTGT